VSRWQGAATIAVAALTLASCVNPPPTQPPVVAPAPATITAVDAQQDLFRNTRAFTVRVRALKCGDVFTGTGWAVNKRTIVTNRHVVEGAQRLEISTWDGQTLAVASAEQATGPDLALIHLAQDAYAVAPRVAKVNPKTATPLHMIGYPEGRLPHENNGSVQRYLDKPPGEPSGTVMQMSGDVEPGNSGSPIVDDSGTVVAVVFAHELSTGWDTAEPVSRLWPVLRGQGLTPVVSC
jgi:S1-C subfamily serine protease